MNKYFDAYRQQAYENDSIEKLAKNGLSIKSWVAIKLLANGTVDIAWPSDQIEGISQSTFIYKATNEIFELKNVLYRPINEDQTYILYVNWWFANLQDVWYYFNITTNIAGNQELDYTSRNSSSWQVKIESIKDSWKRVEVQILKKAWWSSLTASTGTTIVWSDIQLDYSNLPYDPAITWDDRIAYMDQTTGDMKYATVDDIIPKETTEVLIVANNQTVWTLANVPKKVTLAKLNYNTVVFDYGYGFTIAWSTLTLDPNVYPTESDDYLSVTYYF